MNHDHDIEYAPPRHPEIGKRLKASDLKMGDVICIHKPGKLVVTMNVGTIADKAVLFHSPQINTMFIAIRTPDDEITDDAGSMLYMYQYLGT